MTYIDIAYYSNLYGSIPAEDFNRLVIKDGKASVESATCPDGICASHNPIHRKGESIVCLPNRVVITAHSVDSTQPDIIV